ncbi:unnamed protein product [Ectocarpus sp. 4 AP-2014]
MRDPPDSLDDSWFKWPHGLPRALSPTYPPSPSPFLYWKAACVGVPDLSYCPLAACRLVPMCVVLCLVYPFLLPCLNYQNGINVHVSTAVSDGRKPFGSS